MPEGGPFWAFGYETDEDGHELLEDDDVTLVLVERNCIEICPDEEMLPESGKNWEETC